MQMKVSRDEKDESKFIAVVESDARLDHLEDNSCDRGKGMNELRDAPVIL